MVNDSFLPDRDRSVLDSPAGADPVAALSEGFAARAAGRQGEAEALFRHAASGPDQSGETVAEAWGALGDLLLTGGRAADAVEPYRRAAQLAPSRMAWQLGYAEALAAAGDFAAAVEGFSAVLARRADLPKAHLGLGRALIAAGDRDAGFHHLREAHFLSPDDGAILVEFAEQMLARGEALAVVEKIAPAAARSNEEPGFYRLLGQAWTLLGESGQARRAWERCCELDPNGPSGAETALAELGRAEAARSAQDDLPPAYVRALFDRYAERFDQDLTGKLGYRAPQALRAAVDRLLERRPAPSSELFDILDLGCGTGLSGVAFRPLARRLTGVDISLGMIVKADARKLYDALIVDDVVAAMLNAPVAGWDLVVAADVLVYLGNLTPLMAAVRRALKPGGWFAATVERRDGAGYGVTSHRRFTHAKSYVSEVVAAAGLDLQLIEQQWLRREAGQPVEGLVVIACCPS